MIPKNDHLLLGVIVGLLLPALGYFLALQSNDWIGRAISRPFAFKESTVFLVGICSNLLGISYFHRRYYRNALRGIVMVTMLMAIVWFLRFGTDIL